MQQKKHQRKVKVFESTKNIYIIQNLLKFAGQKEATLNESLHILAHYFRKKTLQATEEK